MEETLTSVSAAAVQWLSLQPWPVQLLAGFGVLAVVYFLYMVLRVLVAALSAAFRGL